MRMLLSLLLVVLTLWGIVDAGYITYTKLSGSIPQCSAYFKCGVVLESKWASVGPIPLAFFGILFYSFFFAISLFFYFEKKTVKLFFFRLKTETLLALLGAFGGIFSFYLLFIMGIILKAWCFYCLLSAATCIILFLVSSIIYLRTKRDKPHEMYI